MRRPQPSDLDVEMPMGVRIAQSLRRVWPLAGLLFALAPACPAETPDVSGRYPCTQAKVQGKVIACKAAPLILKNDGHFEFRGWEGNYPVSGLWLELAVALVQRRAKSQPGHKILLGHHGKHG